MGWEEGNIFTGGCSSPALSVLGFSLSVLRRDACKAISILESQLFQSEIFDVWECFSLGGIRLRAVLSVLLFASIGVSSTAGDTSVGATAPSHKCRELFPLQNHKTYKCLVVDHLVVRSEKEKNPYKQERCQSIQAVRASVRLSRFSRKADSTHMSLEVLVDPLIYSCGDLTTPVCHSRRLRRRPCQKVDAKEEGMVDSRCEGWVVVVIVRMEMDLEMHEIGNTPTKTDLEHLRKHLRSFS